MPTNSTNFVKSYRGFNIEPGMNNDEIFNILKMKIENFSEDIRQCMLCFDETAIKANLFYNYSSKDLVIGFEEIRAGHKSFKPALHVLVLMLRGIIRKWKHPLAIFLLIRLAQQLSLKT